MPTFYLVELFSGSGSFARGARSVLPAGWSMQTHSLDIHPKYNPTTTTDILQWDYRTAMDDFLAKRRASDMVWFHASPPCTAYSFARTTAPRDYGLADAIVKRTLRVLRYVRPDAFTIENPVGHLMQRPFMRKLNDRYLNMTSYCKFGLDYRKNTCIWCDFDTDLPKCEKGSYCATRNKLGKHLQSAQAGPTTGGTPGSGSGENVYPLPRKLVRLLVRDGLKAHRGTA